MKFEFSAGGVVYKKDVTTGIFKILIAQHSQHHGWVFPKGLIGDINKKENKEEAAVREVEEETGIKAHILEELTPVTYWYQLEEQKIKKTVYYFTMEYVSGDISKHDLEMENVEWLSAGEVENRLTYNSDKEVWEEAKKVLKI